MAHSARLLAELLDVGAHLQMRAFVVRQQDDRLEQVTGPQFALRAEPLL